MIESSRIHRPSHARRLLAVLTLLLCGAAEGAEVAPADLCRAVEGFRLELEALRWVAGEQPKLAAPPWAARDAAPRHLFWQAQALYGRTFQLSEELAGGRSLSLAADTWRRSQPRTAPSGRDIRLEDVQRLIEDAHDRLRALLRLHNIRVSLAQPPLACAAPSNGAVLAQIVQASRQISLMLRRSMPPRDVYNRVLLAIDQAGNLLDGLYPAPAPLVEGERPADVHQRLVECLRLLPTASAAQGVQLLTLDLKAQARLQNVAPADNYDLATALVSDLAYLGQRLGAAYNPLPRGEYRAPRTVLPSHVQRLAGVLQEQMLALADSSGGPPPPRVAGARLSRPLLRG